MSTQGASLHAGFLLDDRYEIVSLLGEGGFGVVYQARQLSTGQQVAIKLLHPEKLATLRDPHSETARFRREMQLIAQLKHPNVVRLIDTGQLADGRLYTVLEFIDGRELADILDEEGALAPREAARLMGQVLEALAAAHRRGVIHRDLKPQNIMVTGHDRRRNAMVLDFGIATLDEEARGAEFVRLTQTGQIQGTPAYMAPEQLEGSASAQSDLYAWGLVFVECLTGQPVIDADSVAGAIFKQLSAEPVQVPELPGAPALAALLRKACAKPLSARYKTAEEALEVLETLSFDEGEGHDPLPAPRRTAPTDGMARTEAAQAIPATVRETIAEQLEDVALTDTLGPDNDIAADVLARHAKQRGGLSGDDEEHEDLEEQVPRRRRAAIAVAVLVGVALAAVGGAYLWDQQGGEASQACMVGQIRSVDTQQQCCWPGQAWNGERCVGIPNECPPSRLVNAAEQTCSLPPCKDGRERTDDVHCCWPEQAWSSSTEACVGTARCPENTVPDGEQCLSATDEVWLLYTACDAGNMRPCVQLALRLQDGLGVERSPHKAFELLERACTHEQQTGCYYLGVAYRVGQGIAIDRSAAREQLEGACKMGQHEACYDLATLIEEQGGPSLRSTELLVRACEARHLIACDTLGARYEHGVGVLADREKARALYTKACENDYLYGCMHQAWTTLTTGSQDASETAEALLTRACKGGVTLACAQLVRLMEGGVVADNAADRRTLRSRACRAGWYEMCASKRAEAQQ